MSDQPPTTEPPSGGPATTGAARPPVPLVDYLVLEPEPHLVAHECEACGARYFDRRNACAACSATSFHPVAIDTHGELITFTIVAFAAPGVPVPFVAGVVDCGGTKVRANIVGVDPDPDHVRTGMAVRLTTTVVGRDGNGVDAVGFAFEPADPRSGNRGPTGGPASPTPTPTPTDPQPEDR